MTAQSETPQVPTDQQPPAVSSLSVPAPPTNPLADQTFVEGLFKEFSEKGALTPESYTRLESAGIPRSIVDDYVSSKAAAVEVARYRQEQVTNKVYSECGGEAKVKEALAWAQSNLDKASIDAINAQLASSNPEAVITAVKGLQARAGGSMLPGKSGGVPGLAPYASEAEWMADQKKPAYRTDPAFRAQVDARLKAAMQTGVIQTGNIFVKGL